MVYSFSQSCVFLTTLPFGGGKYGPITVSFIFMGLDLNVDSGSGNFEACHNPVNWSTKLYFANLYSSMARESAIKLLLHCTARSSELRKRLTRPNFATKKITRWLQRKYSDGCKENYQVVTKEKI